MGKGAFVVFEGSDGVGKTTQANILKEKLEKDGKKVFLVREPGGTAIGTEVRKIVKEFYGEEAPTPIAELLLFSASRNQLVEKVIKPKILDGFIVICDRFLASTEVYQCIARGVDKKLFKTITKACITDLKVDMTFFFEISEKENAKRMENRNKNEGIDLDRIEKEGDSFFKKIRDGFSEISKNKETDFFGKKIVIDADKSIGEMSNQIFLEFEKEFEKKVKNEN